MTDILCNKKNELILVLTKVSQKKSYIDKKNFEWAKYCFIRASRLKIAKN